MNLVKTAICRAKADKTRNNSWGSGNSLVRISGLFRQVAEQCKRLPQASLLLILVALSPNCYKIIKFKITIISVLVQKLRYSCFHALSYLVLKNWINHTSSALKKSEKVAHQKKDTSHVLPLPLCRWDWFSLEAFFSLKYTFCSRSLNSLLKFILKCPKTAVQNRKVMHNCMLRFHIILWLTKLFTAKVNDDCTIGHPLAHEMHDAENLTASVTGV